MFYLSAGREADQSDIGNLVGLRPAKWAEGHLTLGLFIYMYRPRVFSHGIPPRTIWLKI